MVRNGEFTLADARRVLGKHWRILPACAVGCAALGALVATQFPKKYMSQTVVLVAKPTVPTEYVKPVVTEDLNQRLASMKEQILSRTRLEPVIEKLDLYRVDRGRLHTEDLIERLRKAIEISPLEPMPGTQDRSIPGFSVEVTFDNPRTAQEICTEITSMFMEQNARALEQQAVRTASFIGQQLEEAKANLDKQDAKLAQFKRQYIGSLPEEGPANLSLLSSLNSQLEASTQALSRAQQDKAFNESLLSQAKANWKSSRSGANPQTLEEQLRVEQNQLTALESRYTADYPDVIKAKNRIMDLKKRMAETSNSDNSSTESQTASEPPQIQELRARLRQDEVMIADLTKQQMKIQDQIRLLEGRVQASPMVEQQLKELTRNYQSALDFYNDLLKKQQNSAMATSLAHQQEGEQFHVLDPPSLPTKPSFPKILYFTVGGLGVGIVLALAILYLFMATDNTLHTDREVEMYLKIPVLANLPVIESFAGRAGDAGLLKRSLLGND
jgi:polysaccharide chain length determinant protein (PEP-CTERM system associated)